MTAEMAGDELSLSGLAARRKGQQAKGWVQLRGVHRVTLTPIAAMASSPEEAKGWVHQQRDWWPEHADLLIHESGTKMTRLNELKAHTERSVRTIVKPG
jgi:hypothetical protein